MTSTASAHSPNDLAVSRESRKIPVSGRLVLVRHGESEWNALGKWTGTRDVHLSEKGFRETVLLGKAISDIHFDYAFISQQIRTMETLTGILDATGQVSVPYERSGAINERDYGDYTGLNKWQAREQLGETVFQHLRRDWDYPVPNGETLKMVYQRVVPYYQQAIVPRLVGGQTVLVVSHGNAMRALMKYIEHISDKEICGTEMPFGNILIYHVDGRGRMLDKEERRIDSAPPLA